MHGVTKLQLLLSKADLRLHADSQRMAQGWEQGLRAGVDGAFFSATSITPPFKLRAGSRVAGITAAIAEAMQHVVGYWLARASAIISTLPVLSRKRKKTAINIRRWMAVAASTVGCTLAVAGTLVVKGYRDHPADFWTKRLGELTQSAIYDRDGNFMGSVSMSAMQDDPEQSRRYGFVPLMGPIPPVYLAALLHAENRRYHDGGIHNICGLDPLSSIKSFLWSGGSAGGSTIAQQLARGLKPEWQGQTRMWEKIPRKFMELGAACS